MRVQTSNDFTISGSMSPILLRSQFPGFWLTKFLTVMWPADMGTTNFFIRFNSVSESFDLNQLITHNGFARIDSNQLKTENGFLKFD